MAIKLKNFLEIYEPKSEGDRKFVAKHTIKKTKDANKNDDAVFTGSNVKKYNREDEHGYNPGNDAKVYEEVEPLEEMDVRTAKELASKFRNQGKNKKAALYDNVAAALERKDNTTAQGFMAQIKNIDEASLTPDELKKCEDYVKGMKKNMKSFTSKYGKDAKSVMYGTATKMAKEELETIHEAKVKELYSDLMQHADKKGYTNKAQFKKADYETIGKKYGVSGSDVAVVAGHHTADTYSKLKEETEVEESRGHKILATAMRNMDNMKNVKVPTPAEKKEQEAKKNVKEDLDGTLLGLYLDLDEENQKDMLEMIDAGNKEELIAFAAALDNEE